ncbi:MAG: hypothetical protein PF961_11270 [Planctomycetota bacterium]|jgi:hypothetical protein|nr:hypothetical protein [Planctomycetota bacterium]
MRPAGEEWRVDDAADVLDRAHDEAVVARAEAGIEKSRKGDGCRRLCDRSGAPLKDVEVSIEQTSHAFVFGCSQGSTLAAEASDPTLASRNELFVRLFNGTTAKCSWNERWHTPVERQ